MKDKQEELKGLAQSQRFGLSGKTETCSDESCDWSAPLDCYRLFRRDKQGRRGTAEEGEEEAQGLVSAVGDERKAKEGRKETGSLLCSP